MSAALLKTPTTPKPKDVDIDDLDFDSITFQEEEETQRQSPENAPESPPESSKDRTLSPRGTLSPRPSDNRLLNTVTSDGSRLSPIVSAETEALMRRLQTGPQSGNNLGVPGYSTQAASSYSAAVYGSSPSFVDLGLTKTAESLAHSTGVAAENANAVIVYGEAGTALPATPLLELIAKLDLGGEVLRHWVRDGQHFCFVEFAKSVDAKQAAEKIAGNSLGAVKLTAERCPRITPGRDPRTHKSDSEFKNSTLVLKNLPFQLRQETLAEILAQLPVMPQSINYHYDTTGAFRGMAFVKYNNVDDAFAVFDELNGLDIMGRALRVEYKRRQDNNNHHNHDGKQRHDNHHHHHHDGKNRKHNNHSNSNNHRHPSGRNLNPDDLSADARVFYDQLMVFKNNTRLHELAFPPSLTVHQRKQLHYLADHIGGLTHFAVGEGSSRFLVVSKVQQGSSPSGAASRSWTADKSYLSRSPRYNNRGRDGTSGSWSRSRTAPNKPDILSSSPGSFASMLEQRHANGENIFGGEGRRSRSNTGSDAANVPTRQPRGPDGSTGFSKR